MLSGEDISLSECLRANRLSGEMTAIRLNDALKVTRPSSFFLGGGVPSYFEAFWYPHLYFYRKSNT